MKLSFEKDLLAHATDATQTMANTSSSLPILGNILISADDGGNVTLEASDMESCVRCTIQAEVQQAGSITVPAKTFHSIVRELPSGNVSLDFSSQLAEIVAGGNQYQLTTQSPEDFPTWPDLSAVTTLTLEQKTLKRILSHVLYALPQRDPRKVLLGALFDVKDNQLTCVTTDGKKLGLSKCDLGEIEGAQPSSAIIPGKLLNEILRNLKDEGTVRVLIGERQVGFELDNLVYLGNRIDGIFPNYEMVIPADFTREIRLNRERFLNEVRRAAIISEEHNNSIIMRFEPGKINFSSRTYEVGSFQGTIDIDYDGEAFDIAFNHIYLTESFRVIESEEVIMKIKQNTAPVVFVMPDDDSSLFLVMPIKLTDIAEFNDED
ncbi:MAG: DNA polymerase III subunit beta [Candidatus Sumerlaeota bacterium]